MSTITLPDPRHLQNRLAKARRMADRLAATAEQLGADLGETVEYLTSLDPITAETWWATAAGAMNEEPPSDATVSVVIALLAERA